MAYSTPPTFVASDPLTAAELNALSDDISYLYSALQGVVYSACSVRRAASQSLTTATETEISFDNEDVDVGGWYSSGTDVIVPAGAIPAGATSIGVLLLGVIKYAANTTGARRVIFQNNGGELSRISIGATGGGDPTVVTYFAQTTVVASDVLTMLGEQTSGGALNVTEARFNVIRLGVAS